MFALSGIKRFQILVDYLRTSLWFIPVVMMLGAVGLAALALVADTRLADMAPADIPIFIYFGEAENARGVLSSLFTAMVTMVSLVFSITIVVLTLAASQFGPRLVRNFMASPQTQVVLGLFVMTIVYCLCILSFIGWRGGEEPLPYATVSGAIGLTLASVAMLVVYIHGLARSIVSETVIERVGCELDRHIGEYEELRPGATDGGEAADELPEDFEAEAARFGPAGAGYVQAVDLDEIAKAAEKAAVVVRFAFRAGDFVAEGGKGIAVYPGARCTDELRDAVRGAVVLGKLRTPVQDPAFPVRHMVEIAVRALSPGVNDPYTATAVIDRLSASLSRLMERALPSGVRRDGRGALRVVAPGPTYESLIATGFNMIRQAGADKPIVLLHLFEAAGRIAAHIRTEEQRRALREQCRVLERTARRNVSDPSDLAAVLVRAAAARRALEAKRPEQGAGRS